MQDGKNGQSNTTDDINIKPWQSLGEYNKKHYVYKYYFTSSSYELQVTDGLTLLSELMSSEQLTQKCETLNPNIEASIQEFIKYIQETFEKCISKNSILLKEIEDKSINISYKSRILENIPFSWIFKLTEDSRSKYSEQLIHPLFAITKELQRRQNKLIKLLAEKDREIQDYKDHGTVVSRRYLETTPFDVKSFVNINNVDEEFIASCKDDSNILVLCNNSIKDLYQNIQTNKKCKKISIEEDRPQDIFSAVEASPLPSFVNDQSNEKEKEKERREALRKRLDEESEKKQKKKKRKLKI